MHYRAREGSLTSGLFLEESSSGPVSHLNPKDIVGWTNSIPAPDFSEDSVQAVDWTDAFVLSQPGDNSFSPSSSMDDSAYVSIPDPTMQRAKSADSQFQVLQDDTFADSDPQMMQAMFSPSMSTVSYQGQADSNGFVLPPSSTGSISGELGNLAISQATVWAGQPTEASPTAVAFTQGIHSPIGVRHQSQQLAFNQSMHDQMGMMSQDGMQSSIAQVPYMPSQSPDLTTGTAGVPSRTSSRATMSGYASASSGGTRRTPFTGNSGSVPMLRHYSSVSSTHYMDGASSLSPTSPVMNLQQTSPLMDYSFPDEYSEYLNLDQTVLPEETASEIMAAEEHIKDEAESLEELQSATVAVNENARSDPLYFKTADKDGYYHCPYVATEHCEHKATKLKCNYDKYIDSHLRPFRCSQRDCNDLRFSSTACLLRHQREAHGWHGHGHKPHLCRYADCERSKDGQGFPRKYNLFDHMRRVHNFQGSINDDERPPKRNMSALGRKRGPSGASAAHNHHHHSSSAASDAKSGRVEKKLKASKAEAEAQAAQMRRAKLMQSLQVQWGQRRLSLLQRLQSMQSPEDTVGIEQIREDMAAMEKIAGRLVEMG